MYKLIGNPEAFAIRIEILSYEPSLYGRSAILLGNEQIGVFEEDEDYMGNFIQQLSGILYAYENNTRWDSELDGLGCFELFHRINPFWNNEELLFSISDDEYDLKYKKFDKYRTFFGAHFDRWKIYIVINGSICIFIHWKYYDEFDNPIERNVENVKCSYVEIDVIRDAYKEICKLVPRKFWPKEIDVYLTD